VCRCVWSRKNKPREWGRPRPTWGLSCQERKWIWTYKNNVMSTAECPLKISGRQSVAVSYVLQHSFHVLLTDLQMSSVPSAIFQFILSHIMQLIKYLPKAEVSLLVLTALHQNAFIQHIVLATTFFRSPTLYIIQSVQLKQAFKQSSNINIIDHFKVQIKSVLYVHI
jgi:hypothetical protein